MFLRFLNITAFVFMYVCVVNNTSVYALGYKIEHAKPLPEIKEMSPEQFENASRLVELKPFKNDEFFFSLRVPKKWKADSVFSYTDGQYNDFTYGTVAEFRGAGEFGAFPRIDIQAFDMKHAMSAVHWLYEYILSNGYTINSVYPNNWDEAEILYVSFERGTSYKVRSKVIRSGPRMIMVSYYSPFSRWEDNKDLQAYVVNSFEISDLNAPAAPLRSYEIFNIVEFKFYEDWIFNQENINDIQSITISLTHNADEEKKSFERQKIDGYIQFKLLEKSLSPDLVREINSIKENLENLDYALGDLIETVSHIKSNPDISILGVEGYEMLDLTGDRIDHELWIAVMEDNNYYYIVVLDTPSSDGKYTDWAHNLAAFKKLIESLKSM